MAETALDQAHAAAEAAPDDDAARLTFYARLVEGELCLLLAREPEGDTLDPHIFELDDGPIVLAFDTEERLTAFTELPAPYAALPGRALVEMLQGRALGLGLNLGVAPSARLLPPEIITWLADTLAERPAQLQTQARALHPPRGLPEALLQALDARLARMEGLARCAYLAAAEYDGGGQGHLLAVVAPAPGAEDALARAVQAALTFSGVEAGTLDVTFLAADDARAAELARVGLRFDLPQPDAPRAQAPPGTDLTTPPRLR